MAPSERYLTERARSTIRNLVADGHKYRYVAGIVGVNISTVSRVVNGKSRARTPCGGRKKKTSVREERRIMISFKRFHFKPLRAIQRDDLPDYHRSLLRRRMKQFGLRQLSAIRKPILTTRQRQQRLAFALNHVDRPVTFWQSIFFADEVTFRDIRSGPNPRVICGPSFPKELTKKVISVKFPQSLMVWMAIKHNETPIFRFCPGTLNSRRFVDVIFDAFNTSTEHRRHPRIKMLQDNAPIHNSKYVSQSSLLDLLDNPTTQQLGCRHFQDTGKFARYQRYRERFCYLEIKIS